MHQQNAIFRHVVKLPNTKIKSGAIDIEIDATNNKMPRTLVSLISVTYDEHGAFIKPHPNPNKKVAINIIHTDDE